MKLSGITALIVDNEEELRDLTREMLMIMGMKKFFFAESVEEAQKILLKQNDINLIVSDINMPGLTGLEFLEWVRDREREKGLTPVEFILMTGEPSEKKKRIAQYMNAYFLEKTFTFKELMEMVLDCNWGQTEKENSA